MGNIPVAAHGVMPSSRRKPDAARSGDRALREEKPGRLIRSRITCFLLRCAIYYCLCCLDHLKYIGGYDNL